MCLFSSWWRPGLDTLTYETISGLAYTWKLKEGLNHKNNKDSNIIHLGSLQTSLGSASSSEVNFKLCLQICKALRGNNVKS